MQIESPDRIWNFIPMVREQLTPYAKPMECGNHEDVRWAALSGNGFPTLLVQADNTNLQVSALPYTDEVMTPVEYSVDLPPSTSTVVTVAARTLGVGSAVAARGRESTYCLVLSGRLLYISFAPRRKG